MPTHPVRIRFSRVSWTWSTLSGKEGMLDPRHIEVIGYLLGARHIEVDLMVSPRKFKGCDPRVLTRDPVRGTYGVDGLPTYFCSAGLTSVFGKIPNNIYWGVAP